MDVYSLTDKELVDELKARGISTGPVMASTRRLYQKKLEKLIAAGDAIDGPEPEEEYSDEEEEEDSPPVTRSSSRSSSPRKRKNQSRSPARSPARSAGRSPARSPARSTRSSGRLRKREEEIERMSQDEDEVENEEDEIEDEGEDVIEMKPEARSQVTRRTVTSVEQSFTSTSRPAVQPSQFSSYKPKVPEVPQKKSGSKRLSILVQLGIFIIVATLIFVILQNL